MTANRSTHHHAWGRAAILLTLLLSACSSSICKGGDGALPQRTSWPALSAYPGADIVEQRTSPPEMQAITFRTTASPAEVMNYYRHLLTRQGWFADSQRGLYEDRACPKLTLDLQPLESTDAGQTYRVSFKQTPCSPYC